jgi:hypothetical protein
MPSFEVAMPAGRVLSKDCAALAWPSAIEMVS